MWSAFFVFNKRMKNFNFFQFFGVLSFSIVDFKTRWILAFLSSLSVSVFLFYFMSYLISEVKEIVRPVEDSLVIQFVRFKRDSTLNERKRVLPKKPPQQKPPPNTNFKMSEVKPSLKLAQNIRMPHLDFALKGTGPALGGGSGYMGQNSGDAVPMVRIQPRYPRKARLLGLEGWVLLKYDITPLGTVENAKILDSHPARVFDHSAIKALLKWKFKPRKEEGKFVAQRDLRAKIDFKFDGS